MSNVTPNNPGAGQTLRVVSAAPVKRPDLVVVVGMHRTGTSVITRSLQTMGIDLGDNLMAPNPDVNPKGFWEDMDFNAIDMEILTFLGKDWHYISPLSIQDVEKLHESGYMLRGVELLRKKVVRGRIFGVKDPRVAKLLPFWKGVFDHSQLEVAYVISLRHPLSVTKSLIKRDQFAAEKCYLMWLEHVLVTLSETRGSTAAIVDYDALMNDPERAIARVADNLGLTVNGDELESYSAEFLDHSLRHTLYSARDLELDESCPPLVKEVYAQLAEVARGDGLVDHEILRPKLDRWLLEFERDKTILNWSDRVSLQLEELKGKLTNDETQIAQLNEQLGEKEGSVAQLQAAVSKHDSELTGLRGDLAASQSQVITLSHAVSERESRIEGIAEKLQLRETAIAGLESDLFGFERRLAAREAQVADLVERLAKRDSQLAESSGRLAAHAQEIEWLRGNFAERDAQLKEVQERLDASEASASALTIEASSKEERIAELNAQLASVDARRESEIARITIERDDEVARLDRAFAQRQQELEALSINLGEQIANLHEALNGRDKHIGDLAYVVGQRDEEVASLNAQIGELDALLTQHRIDLDRQVADLNEALNGRDKHIGELAYVVGRRDEELAAVSAQVGELDALLLQHRTEFDRQVASFNDALNARNKHVADLVNVIGRREEEITALNAQIGQLDAVLAQQRADFDRQVVDFDEALNGRDKHIGDLAYVVGQRDEDVAARNAQIGELDALLARQRADFDRQVAEFNEAMNGREKHIGDLIHVVGKRDEELAARAAQIGQLDALLAHHRNEIEKLTQDGRTRQGQLSALAEQLAQREKNVQNLVRKVVNQDMVIDELSGSWIRKLTSPLRLISELFK
jgi:hypothetical protein